MPACACHDGNAISGAFVQQPERVGIDSNGTFRDKYHALGKPFLQAVTLESSFPSMSHDMQQFVAAPAQSMLIDELLAQAEHALAAVTVQSQREPAAPFHFRELSAAAANDAADARECGAQLDLKIELGRSQMVFEDVLKLRKGSVVALDKLATERLDIVVHGRLVARGEVVVLENNYCVRVVELMGSNDDK